MACRLQRLGETGWTCAWTSRVLRIPSLMSTHGRSAPHRVSNTSVAGALVACDALGIVISIFGLLAFKQQRKTLITLVRWIDECVGCVGGWMDGCVGWMSVWDVCVGCVCEMSVGDGCVDM